MFLLFEGFHPQNVLILFLFSIEHYLLGTKFTPDGNLFLANVPILYTPWKHQKIKTDFLVFSGGIK